MFVILLFLAQIALWGSQVEGFISEIVHTEIPPRRYHLIELRASNAFATDGVMYRQSVCTRKELEKIQHELNHAMKHLSDERSSIAQHRTGATLSRDGEIAKIFQGGSIFSLAQRVVGNNGCRHIQISNEIPIEVRIYEKMGASMAWHQDDVLYDPPQLEIVFTVENTSDCVTMWKVGSDLHSQETHPNSIIILRAGGPEHCVTSLKRGRRMILKCAYILEGATFVGDNYQNQFKEARSSKAIGKIKQK